jgi:hypothetical protein
VALFLSLRGGLQHRHRSGHRLKPVPLNLVINPAPSISRSPAFA